MQVSIVGKGVGWELAPENGETWGVNDVCFRRRVDLIFQLHISETGLFKEIIDYATLHRIPILTLSGSSPTGIKYPLGKMHTDYFTNSISFMIAYAIYTGIKQVDLYGCVLWGGTEYYYQRPNVEYWIGYARGQGMEVNIHGNSNLMKAHNDLVYGYNQKQVLT